MSDPEQSPRAVKSYVVHDALGPDSELQRLLQTAWSKRHDAGVGFRYRLRIERERVIEGQFGFLLQLNKQRLTERRQPQQFQLAAPFDPTKFHFALVDPSEVLLELRIDSATNRACASHSKGASAGQTAVSLMINNSPLTPYHSLVLPERELLRPQVLTLASLRAALALLMRLPDRRYRLGYNSPGALASVNHLHLHLLRIDRDLYVQSADLIPIKGFPLLHRLPDHLPAQGFCYVLRDQADLPTVCEGLHRLVSTLLERRLAHNLFFTWTHLHESSTSSTIRVVVYPRIRQCANKTACSFNAAFLELSGFVPVGEPSDFEGLTEVSVVRALREAQGDVYGALRDIFAEENPSAASESVVAADKRQ
uniref:GDP-D-glucose phosphorylase 1 n=1 Tax=Anopheles atroparvus TaxID=41427 RepID=A0A182IYG9_ANOAO